MTCEWNVFSSRWRDKEQSLPSNKNLIKLIYHFNVLISRIKTQLILMKGNILIILGWLGSNPGGCSMHKIFYTVIRKCTMILWKYHAWTTKNTQDGITARVTAQRTAAPTSRGTTCAARTTCAASTTITTTNTAWQLLIVSVLLISLVLTLSLMLILLLFLFKELILIFIN